MQNSAQPVTACLPSLYSNIDNRSIQVKRIVEKGLVCDTPCLLLWCKHDFRGAYQYFSPSLAIDDAGAWDDEAYAYDGITGTGAISTIPINDWGDWLVFVWTRKFIAKACEIYALYNVNTITKCMLQVYRDGAWFHLFSGSHSDKAWFSVDYNLPRYIVALRIRFYNDDDTLAIPAVLYEIRAVEYIGKEVRFINGFTSSGEVIYNLGGTAFIPESCVFKTPVLFNKGLYVYGLDSNINVTVGYVPLKSLKS